MRNVRWAHAALLAVVLPACAHTSQNEVEHPGTVQGDDSRPEHIPAESDWTAKVDGKATAAQRVRPIFLAANNTSDQNTTYPLKQSVIVDAPSCDPWSADAVGRCDLSDMVTTSIR
jgi:hypothetical protein